VSPTNVASSLSPPRCRLSSGRHYHATTLYYTSFPWSQDVLAISASSFSNASSCCLPSRAKTEVLNPYHRSLATLHCYKKVISTLVILPTTQLHLHFASSLARAPRYRSFTHRHRSLSPSSHAYRPSAQ
jgi:hypothetical protein